jgi:hypothetical protein
VYSIACKVGRFLEVRVVTLRTLADVRAYERELLRAFAVAGPRPVGICDLRYVGIFPPDVADALVGTLARGGTSLERSALLLAPALPALALQIERIVREAGDPQRRTFRTPADATAWLGEVLTPPELARLETFLAEPSPGAEPRAGSRA